MTGVTLVLKNVAPPAVPYWGAAPSPLATPRGISGQMKRGEYA